MKTTLLIFLFFGLIFQGQAQTQKTIGWGYHNYQGERYFYINGDSYQKYVDSMFVLNPKTKRKGYIHKFSNVKIEGLEGTYDIKIQEGVSWITGFNTFTSEKYRKKRIARMTDQEVFGTIIYVKKNKKDVIRYE